VRPRRSALKNPLVLVLVCVSALLLARIHGWSPFEGEVSSPGGDLTKTELPEGVIDKKNSVKNNDGDPASLTKPLPVSGPQIKISLSGKPGISSSLAQLTAEKLEKLLAKKNAANPQIISITGQIVIWNINEMPADKKGALTTLMTVAVNGLTFEGGKKTRSLPVLSVTIQGKGSPKAFLPEVATALAREIANEISFREKSKKAESPGSGFE